MSATPDTAAVTASELTNLESNQSYRSPRSSIHWSDPTVRVSSRIPQMSIFSARS